MNKPNHVYIIQASNGRVKIGIARDPIKRFEKLAIVSPLTLDLIHFFEVDNAWQFEWRLHIFFDALRHHNEWFDLSQDQVQWLCTLDEDSWHEVLKISEPYMERPRRYPMAIG